MYEKTVALERVRDNLEELRSGVDRDEAIKLLVETVKACRYGSTDQIKGILSDIVEEFERVWT